MTLFTALTFICLFFPLTLVLYWILPQSMKQCAFLGLSVLFLLLCNVVSAVGMCGLTVLTVAYGKSSVRLRSHRHLYRMLTVGLLLLYGAGFFVWSVLLFRQLSQSDSFLRFCPFGVAFFVVQGMRYVAEVFTGEISGAERVQDTAEYLLFYPRLVMGPVQSYSAHIAMKARAVLSVERMGRGMQFFICGLAKKVLLADTVGMIFSAQYAHVDGSQSVLFSWLTLLAFLVQFFLTVSGYGEMAKGIALCYGFSLPDDYENPLFSGSLSAFGQRWNRSVVGCSAACFSLLLRTQKWQSVLGNMLTWGLLGIWYRPSLHMLVCGLWMGFWIGMDQYLRNKMQKIPALVDAIAFFLVFCCGGAVFSAPSLLEGGVRIGLLFGSSGMIVQDSDWYVVQSGSVILLLALYCASGHFTKWVEKLQQKAVPARMLHVLELPVQLLLLALSLLVLSVA